MACGDPTLAGVQKNSNCWCISKNKEFVAPLCGFVLHVLFHADAGLGCDHPHLCKCFYKDESWLGRHYLSVEKLVLEKSVIVITVPLPLIVFIFFRVTQMQGPQDGFKAAPWHLFTREVKVVWPCLFASSQICGVPEQRLYKPWWPWKCKTPLM